MRNLLRSLLFWVIVFICLCWGAAEYFWDYLTGSIENY